MITVKRNTAITLLVLTTIFWESSYAFTKAMTVHFPPLWVVTLRFGLSGLILFVLSYREIISAIRNSTGSDLLQLCSLGVINFVAILCYTTSLQTIKLPIAALFFPPRCCLYP